MRVLAKVGVVFVGIGRLTGAFPVDAAKTEFASPGPSWGPLLLSLPLLSSHFFRPFVFSFFIFFLMFPFFFSPAGGRSAAAMLCGSCIPVVLLGTGSVLASLRSSDLTSLRTLSTFASWSKILSSMVCLLAPSNREGPEEGGDIHRVEGILTKRRKMYLTKRGPNHFPMAHQIFGQIMYIGCVVLR